MYLLYSIFYILYRIIIENSLLGQLKKSCIIKEKIIKYTGFSLISVLISIGLFGMVISMVFSALSIQNKESKAIQQKLASASLKYRLLGILSDPSNCVCQFHSCSIQNKRCPSVPRLTNHCQLNPDIIARSGHPIGAGVKIKSMKVRDIEYVKDVDGYNANGFRDTGQDKKEYSGTLAIHLDPSTIIRALRTIDIPLRFMVDTSYTIKECGASTQYTDLVNQWGGKLRSERNQALNNLRNTLRNERTLAINNLGSALRDERTLAIGSLRDDVTLLLNGKSNTGHAHGLPAHNHNAIIIGGGDGGGGDGGSDDQWQGDGGWDPGAAGPGQDGAGGGGAGDGGGGGPSMDGGTGDGGAW